MTESVRGALTSSCHVVFGIFFQNTILQKEIINFGQKIGNLMVDLGRVNWLMNKIQ